MYDQLKHSKCVINFASPYTHFWLFTAKSQLVTITISYHIII